jgi:hypothetical protein
MDANQIDDSDISNAEATSVSPAAISKKEATSVSPATILLDLNSFEQCRNSPSLAPDSEELELTQLLPSQQKSVHLVTWSRANAQLLDDPANPRESFGKLLQELFYSKSQTVLHWACAKEMHKYGGYHFHVSMQFGKKTRWFAVAKELCARNIKVNFQSFHTKYSDAFRYITKEDTNFVTSVNHPMMLVIPPKSMPTKRRRLLDFDSQGSSSNSGVGDIQEFSFLSNRQNTSSVSNSQIPSSGINSHMPSSGSNSQMPSSGSNSQMPSSGSNSQMPSSWSNSQMPSSGSNSQMPSSGSNSQMPSGNNSQMPSSGSNSQMPSGSNSQMPSSGRNSQRSSSASDNQRSSTSSTRQSSTSAGNKPKIDRLNNIQVAQIIVDNDIKSDLELCFVSCTFLNNDQPELANWIVNHPTEKYRLDVIKTAWKMQNAEEVLERKNMPRIERLQLYLNADHASDEENGLVCNGRWLQAALEILSRNNISIAEWQERIRNCLKFGRNKKNNIFLVGERNCSKSFLLRPLTIVFDTFCNPATGSFNWVGAHEKEVILLNDFRYPAIDRGADKVMNWQDLLNLCDADKLSIQAPKSFYAENIEWTARQPIFGNGPRKISYIRNGIEDRAETAMMDARMVYINLPNPIPEENLDHTILACARCFSHLVLNGQDME